MPIAVANSYLGSQAVYYNSQPLLPIAVTNGYTLFGLPVSAPSQTGDFQGSLEFRVGGPVLGAPSLTFDYAVRDPVDSRAGGGLVWINPTMVSPPNYSVFGAAPKLCFSEPAVAGSAPFSFRVMISGEAEADSGWMADHCWTPPALAHGTYYWKVFVRDGQGHMNRTNERPYVFKIT